MSLNFVSVKTNDIFRAQNLNEQINDNFLGFAIFVSFNNNS